MSEQAINKCWNCDKYPAVEDGYCDGCLREVRMRTAMLEELPKAKDAIEALHRLADSAAGIEALKRALEITHRTNQQLVCRAIVAMLEKWHADALRGPGHWDARNEASVLFAKAVFEGVPERKRYFPYI